MILPKIEDKFPGFNGTAYKVTNEAPEDFIAMLGDRTFSRGASICSGGEVPLFVFLPRCDEVIAIDHSIGSLANTYIKAVMLSQLGPKGMLDVLGKTYKNFMAEAHNILTGNVPEVLQPHVKLAWDGNAGTEWKCNFSHYDMNCLSKEWCKVGVTVLEQVHARLDRLTFVHGDVVLDLPEYGMFDLLYISNAIEHTSRKLYTGYYGLRLPQFEPLVKVGGLLLAAGTLYNETKISGANVQNGKWKPLQKKSSRSSWMQHLLERTAEDVVL